MIKRAKLTLYNAQESDTFGKDAEAGVTLAQQKPVVVYVARLFGDEPGFSDVYRHIDEGARDERDEFVERLTNAGLLDTDKKLLAPDKTKADALQSAVERVSSQVLQGIDERRLEAELLGQGYSLVSTTNLREQATQRILKLERRALVFREVHPLSLQTSPNDGVARGVIVTRSVASTAEVVKNILLGTLRYEIREDEYNWLLVDKITHSPVRVVTKDTLLTTAFWEELWSELN